MAQKTKKRKAWSYIAGKKGSNRIRAYEDADGRLYLDWQEPVFDNQGLPVVDPLTKLQRKKRQRLSLTAAGITTYSDAMEKGRGNGRAVRGVGAGGRRPEV
ncbi:MAG TPA: hypothetical protein VEX86_14000 [Longimicrobium sp.]|nr:hypothetical protein [Longimicrobium sp.]